MSLSDEVKKLAMDAVNNKATMEFARYYTSRNQPVKKLPLARDTSNDQVKKQAMDAIAGHRAVAQIRLSDVTGSISPLGTPSARNGPLTDKINWMHQRGQPVDTVHEGATKDKFGRDYA